MPATKSGPYINITGTGNTLATMYSDINDNTWVSRTTEPDGSYTYTINSANVNYIILSTATSVLTIGNPNDFSFKEKLKFTYSSSNRGYIQTVNGSHLKIYGNVELDMGCISNSQYTGNNTFYGNLTILGNDTYKPFIYNTRRWVIYGYDTDATRIANSTLILENIIVGNGYFDLYIFYFSFQNFIHTTISIKNITLYINSAGLTYNSLFVSGAYQNVLFDRLVFENLNVYPGHEPKAIMYSQLFGTIKNTTWNSQINSYIFIDHTANTNSEIRKENRFLSTAEKKILSSKKQEIDVVWDNVVTSIPKHSYTGLLYQKIMLFKNCTNSSNKPLYGGYCATALCWNSDTYYTAGISFGSDDGITIRKVFLLDLTIKDETGNPIEGCYIKVQDKNGHEEYNLETNSNGKLYSYYNIGGVLLSNRLKTLTGETIVSDSSNSTYHTVNIYKPGFKPFSFNVVMDRDRAVDVVLKPIGQIQKLRGTVRQYNLSGIVKQFKLKGKVKRNG